MVGKIQIAKIFIVSDNISLANRLYQRIKNITKSKYPIILAKPCTHTTIIDDSIEKETLDPKFIKKMYNQIKKCKFIETSTGLTKNILWEKEKVKR